MLADLVMEWPKGPYGSLFGDDSQKAYESFAKSVAAAPRFDLQRDAVFLIENLSRTVMPSRIIDALPLCRLPYPRMWIEFVFRDRDDWVRIAGEEGRYTQQDWGDDEQPKPQRLGMLLEDISGAGGGHKIEAKLVWNFHHVDILNFCAQSMVMDLEPRPMIQPSDEELERQAQVRGKNTWAASWHGKRVEEIAALDLEDRISMRTPPHIKPSMDYTRMVNGPAAANEFLRSAIYDLSGEWKFITAVLMVLNSRNVIEYGNEVSYDKLNKQRVKKGKEPLLSHRPITLHLSRAQHSRMGTGSGGGGSATDIRPHLVRGHWKLRKTGLFFWSTHMRKEESEAPPPTYRVRA